MAKTLMIDYVAFEVKNPRNENKPDFTDSWKYDGKNLFDYYNNPSRYKEEIWDSWRRWADANDYICAFGVSGANSNFFSIEGAYTDPITHTEYLLRITKSHNYAIICK